ncbi:acetoacetyl-CoA synthetase [Flexivirga endophytica]|uniref:Acetoacetyl-CoA synthetase n=1 Tax=Flexivirga endophytica TaxID=1849103 RepID=A0A916WW61_9MICO|nr:acetoacetate--CoA ligase [Flexivirga endophytica]GGB37271.1 acetoacetyl-CoA synthetase [Flexivirga endophytica]GHB44875.1 acetoacetyl-CoA synthetase [Flexivirga endophytica]
MNTENVSTARALDTGDVVWRPPANVLDTTRVGAFLQWLRTERGVELAGHDELWRWSVDQLEDFWAAIWDFFEVTDHGARETVLEQRVMPGARWFTESRLSYAEQALKGCGDDDAVAIQGRSQTRGDVDLTWAQLRDQVARARRVLRDRGVGPGDRVAGYLPNTPEAVVAFLAAAGLGAIWTSCAIEFGPRSVIDRFGQVEPTVLLVAGGYSYGDKPIDRSEQIAAIRAELPTVRTVFDIEYGDWRVTDATSWPSALGAVADPIHETTPVPFDHPLVVLFSSGTTGKPKAIVHGHGGIVLEHLKNHALSWDLGPGDVMLWYSTTAWMMWNALVSGLLVGATIVLVDGNPSYPDLTWQWDLAEETGATLMGASPGFIMACRGAGVDLSGRQLRIRVVGSAGSPLPPEGYGWIHDQLGDDVQLNVGSGGTDVCSGLVQNNPLLPVRAGMISGRALGVDVHAFDPNGRELIGEPGELVVLSPMPSMPIGFWGDDGTRLTATYFDTYPGVWRHGDWIVFEPDGSCVVTGRSDSTLNRGGVRLGTAEFYRVVEELPEVGDSLVIHLEDPQGGNGELILFVTTTGDIDAQRLRSRVSGALRSALSPRHVPDQVVEVPAIPRNLTGKKLEVPVKRILQGANASDVVSADALADPTSIDAFVAYAADRRKTQS